MGADEVARKRMAHVIAIGIEPSGKDDEDESKPDGDPGLESAMEELAMALDKKDFKAAAEAFESAAELCKHKSYDAETEGDDSEG